jgi:hypothetical protein
MSWYTYVSLPVGEGSGWVQRNKGNNKIGNNRAQQVTKVMSLGWIRQVEKNRNWFSTPSTRRAFV